MNILITGVAGLIGSRFADYLVKNKDCKVIGIDDLSGGYENNIPDEVIFYKINLMDYNLVDEIFEKHNINIIYHFAAYAAEGLSPFIRKFNYNNNLLCSTHLINCAIKNNIRRFVFTSSMATYGFGDGNLPFTEETPQVPIDPYGIAKLAVEMDIKIAGEQHNMDWCIIRPHNVYGANQNIWDKYRNVLGIWMYQLLNKQNPTIFGDGSQVRAFSYVDDSILPFWNASQKNSCIGEIINLGGIKEHTINDACNVLINVTGQNLKPVHLEARHETKYAWSTWEKSVKLLDFKHQVDLEEGLSKMWEWAKKQPNRERFIWPKYELNKGIYDYWKN